MLTLTVVFSVEFFGHFSIDSFSNGSFYPMFFVGVLVLLKSMVWNVSICLIDKNTAKIFRPETSTILPKAKQPKDNLSRIEYKELQ